MNNRQIVALVIGVIAAFAAMLAVSPPVPRGPGTGPRVLGMQTAMSYQRMSLTGPVVFLGVGALTAWAVYALRSRGPAQ